MITAQFGNHKFVVSSNQIHTPNGVTFSEESNIEETEVAGSKPTITKKGYKAMQLSFDIKLDFRFVDIDFELNYWKSTLKRADPALFKLGFRSIGYFRLTKYDVKDIVLGKSGIYLSATISLSFIEDEQYIKKKEAEAAKKKAAATKASTQKTTVSASIKVGSKIKPKSGVRWYYTAEGALKKTGKSGKAYNKTMAVTYIYKKNGKIVCVNPLGLGWLKVEDVTLYK